MNMKYNPLIYTIVNRHISKREREREREREKREEREREKREKREREREREREKMLHCQYLAVLNYILCTDFLLI